MLIYNLSQQLKTIPGASETVEVTDALTHVPIKRCDRLFIQVYDAAVTFTTDGRDPVFMEVGKTVEVKGTIELPYDDAIRLKVITETTATLDVDYLQVRS